MNVVENFELDMGFLVSFWGFGVSFLSFLVMTILHFERRRRIGHRRKKRRSFLLRSLSMVENWVWEITGCSWLVGIIRQRLWWKWTFFSFFFEMKAAKLFSQLWLVFGMDFCASAVGLEWLISSWI